MRERIQTAGGGGAVAELKGGVTKGKDLGGQTNLVKVEDQKGAYSYHPVL